MAKMSGELSRREESFKREIMGIQVNVAPLVLNRPSLWLETYPLTFRYEYFLCQIREGTEGK